jgi:thiosulfate dehydrogenase
MLTKKISCPSRPRLCVAALLAKSRRIICLGLMLVMFVILLPLLNQTLKAKEDSAGDPRAAETYNYPPGELGAAIRLGKELVEQTSSHPLTKEHVGNVLNCTSCHLESGQHLKAASFIGVASAYPAFSLRENAVITLEERIRHCFARSQNGTRPPYGSKAVVSIAAYITWLSRGTRIEMNATAPLGPNHVQVLDPQGYEPDSDRGRSLYSERCAECHAEDGSGNDEGPPVWGDQSYNDGAGLAKLGNLASWLKVAMPLDNADLSNDEAFDIAVYITSQARPSFQENEEK